MIHGMNNIMAWFRDKKSPYWKLKNKEGENAMLYGCCDDSQEVSLQDSEERLKSILKMYSPNSSRFYLECWPTKDQKRERFKTLFELLPGEGSQMGQQGAAVTGPPSDYMSPAQVQQMITDALDKKAKADELVQLKRELKELRDYKNNDYTGKFFQKVGPHIEGIVKHIFPPKNGAPANSAVSGSENQNSSQGNENNEKTGGLSEQEWQQRCGNAIEIWSEADPEGFIAAMEKVARLAKEDPTKYNMAKNYL